MERKFSLPEQRDYQEAYELALKLARQKLSNTDIEEQCQKAGAELEFATGRQIITLEYLNQAYQIILPEADVLLANSREPVPPRDKLLILHYLTLAEGSPLTSEKITFKELPGGISYFPTFYQRAIKPLVENFGQKPQRLLDAATKLGAYKADYGDVAITINAFSRVPLTLVLWQGDDEFAPEGSILFDSSVSGYLSTEDITVLCETITWKLARMSRA
jgi:hypothetical protein